MCMKEIEFIVVVFKRKFLFGWFFWGIILIFNIFILIIEKIEKEGMFCYFMRLVYF